MEDHGGSLYGGVMTTEGLDALLGTALIGAFLILAGSAFVAWSRHRESAHLRLAAAAGLMAVVSVSFRLAEMTGAGETLARIAVFALLGSGYALLLVRDAIIPLAPVVRRRVGLGLVAVAAAGAVVGFPVDEAVTLSFAELIVVAAVSAAWALCVAEPIVRFWREAAGRPVVQRARLRALSAGYAGLVGVLVTASVLFGSDGWTPASEAPALVVSLAMVAIQLMMFLPPRRLRRAWRHREERHLLTATGTRLFQASDRSAAGAEAIAWATRLLGGAGAFLADGAGTILATDRVSSADVRTLIAGLDQPRRPQLCRAGAGPSALVAAVPIELEDGMGTLGVVAGPFTPRFADDELSVLEHYGQTVAAVLDRLRVDEMRGAFLNGLSHELRTPLTSVVGMARTLQDDRAGRLEEHRRHDLVDRMVTNAERLERLLTDLLDVDRLARGVIAPRRAPTRVDELVRRVVGSCAGRLRGRHVVLSLEPLVARLDAPMVERMVENLITNAAKHTPVTATIWIQTTAAPGGVEIRASDDGPGIPREIRNTIFEPFKRGPTAPAHAPGSGIGLSLVARFAELHGGRATVEDRPGGGSVFRAFLAADIAAAPDMNGHAAPMPA